jgi:hypothetical protein
MRLLAFCVAQSVDAVRTKTPHSEERIAITEALASALDLDMGKWFRPTAENYFGRVSKAQTLDALREANGYVQRPKPTNDGDGGSRFGLPPHLAVRLRAPRPAGARHGSRRRLLSMTLFGSPAPRSPQKAMTASLGAAANAPSCPRRGGHSNPEALMTTTPKLSEADLRQFAGGTGQWYRHALNRNILFTDGAKYVADEGGAYWLLDEIALSQRSEKRLTRQPFQVWKLAVNPDQTGTITVEDGNYNVVFTKALDYTDFPAPEVTLWFAGNVIYLPAEH